MFDTHCHLQFSPFEGKVDQIILEAQLNGVEKIVVPGTDVATSKKAVEIAHQYENIYAAVGIHPHHAYELHEDIQNEIEKLKTLLKDEKVVAVGEIGLDRHVYKKTKYDFYTITDEFMAVQKELFLAQLKLALTYRRSVIIHNRETKDELLELVSSNWDNQFKGRMVFHCCEPDEELLDFAKKHHVYIGVDGDITYRKDKQEFVKHVPLELLVLETDAPFLLPEPLRSKQKFPNNPSNLLFINNFIASLCGQQEKLIEKVTTTNSQKLFFGYSS